MTVQFPSPLDDFGPPDAFGAAASYVEREYGPTGYSMAVATANSRRIVFEVNHFDGSRFNVIADKWGNVETIPDDCSYAEACEQVSHFAKRAATV